MQIAWRWPDAAMGLDPARMQGCNPGRSRTNLQFLRDDGNRHMLQTRLWLNRMPSVGEIQAFAVTAGPLARPGRRPLQPLRRLRCITKRSRERK